ncbi:hypothetical protein BT63DRAFT_422227 [Microthyrium microscopicum]|uniref:DNA damage-binding protein 1 n=1 Tax=Microthyrium microscopicum TaxID=703497 RepID=A0A6A6UJ20_9PEZI|nr:hypothetical protein BT63DRAFT_422227 [Microthyrium microscopicum]
MAYITPIHRPSGIRLALKLNLIDPDSESLVVAKFNRIETYQIGGSGAILNLVGSHLVYGRIVVLNKFRPADSLVDHIFVGTDTGHFFTASWNSNTQQLDTVFKLQDLADRTAREVQSGERSLVDPLNEFMLLEIYEGILTTIPLVQWGLKGVEKGIQTKRSVLDEVAWSRIPEFNVKSAAFSQRPRGRGAKPEVALLWEDYEGNARMRFREIHYQSRAKDTDVAVEYRDSENQRDTADLDVGASHLIPVPNRPYGIIVLAETKVSWFDDGPTAKDHIEALPHATIWTSWARIDNLRYVLADEFGKLYSLNLHLDREGLVDEMEVEELGTTSQAACLVYLSDDLLFVGSHHGDSQVVRITDGTIEIIQTIASLSPILDFTVMDMGNRSGDGPANEFSTGQARIVTGSGAWQDGSIRSVRSGVGVKELGLLPDLENTTAIFSLRLDPSQPKVNAILLSFTDESRLLQFDSSGAVEELDAGMALDSQTLLARNIHQSSQLQLLQVTQKSVIIRSLVSNSNPVVWNADNGVDIIAATANDERLVICLGGNVLQVFNFQDGIKPQRHLAPPNYQISCIALSSIPSLSEMLFVGFWNSGVEEESEIGVIRLSTGEWKPIRSTESGEERALPRSILISTVSKVNDSPILFAALADGHVATYEIGENGNLKLAMKTVLGTRQAELTELTYPDGQLKSIFVASEHSSLIYEEQGRLTFSAVDTEQVNCVCPFDSEAFPNSVIFATSDDIKIAQIDYERTTHVQPLQIGETARRLVYSRALKVFGIGTIARSIQDGAEISRSSFKVVEEVMFKEVASYELKNDELIESVLRTELDDGYGSMEERFIVGTSFVEDDTVDEFRGRIIIFELTADQTLRPILQHSIKGACRCLGMVDGKIVAAMNKTVAIFSYDFSSGRTPGLTKLATYRTSTMPISMCITGDTIAVADLMKSVSILQYKSQDKSTVGKHSLTEIARHYQTLWGTAVCQVGPHSWLESDAEGNLLVLSRNLEGATADDLRRLQVDSEFCIGELVNRMQSIDVETSADSPVVPKALLATREGSLYLFGLIADNKRDLLMNLQDILAESVKSLGDIDFKGYRAFRNDVRMEEEPRRFVDGELIERFLDSPPEVQQQCVDALNRGGQSVTVTDVRDIVDHLRRLH